MAAQSVLHLYPTPTAAFHGTVSRRAALGSNLTKNPSSNLRTSSLHSIPVSRPPANGPCWSSTRRNVTGPHAQFRDKEDEDKSIPDKVKEAVDRATGMMGGKAAPGERGMRSDVTGMQESAKEMASRAADRVTGGAQERQREGVFATSGTLGFTKRNELFVGRMAMLGFGAAVIGEMFTGVGPLQQLNFETGIPVNQAPPLLLGFILFMIFGSFTALGLGAQGYYEADPDQPIRSAAQGNWRGMLGLPSRGPLFGFSRPNEFFNGRMAQLGFAACLLGEIATGRGAIGQLSMELGVPFEVLAPLVLVVPLMFVSLVNADYSRD